MTILVANEPESYCYMKEQGYSSTIVSSWIYYFYNAFGQRDIKVNLQ